MKHKEAERQLELAKGALDTAGVQDHATIKQAYATLGLGRAVAGLLELALADDTGEK